MAHRGQQRGDPDPATRPGRDPLTVAETGVHRLHHGLQRQPFDQMELRGVTHLCIDHPVGGQILNALAGDPVQSVNGLHHHQCLGEGLEVPLERAGIGVDPEPGAKCARLTCRKPLVANGVGELDDRLRAQSAVQVVMQKCLGRT